MAFNVKLLCVCCVLAVESGAEFERERGVSRLVVLKKWQRRRNGRSARRRRFVEIAVRGKFASA
jgi:hypothetical protein